MKRSEPPADPPGDPPAWLHRDAVVNGVRLHYVEAGNAAPGRPTVLLLHGFPEFWYSWRHQVGPLADAGFHVVVPDLRGYAGSAKPNAVRDYRLEALVADVLALARHTAGGRPVTVVGHDWGGILAWHTAMADPGAVGRLAILNAPHPAAYLREVRKPAQLLRSWYVLFFQLPWLPEAVLRFNDCAWLRRIFRTGPAKGGDVERYARAFAERRSLTAAINYYRAAFRVGPRRLLQQVKPIDVPTLLIWGERDPFLVRELTLGLEPWVRRLRVERLPDADHWAQNDQPGPVNDLLIRFLQEGRDGGGG